jgi:hypothetical protein
MRLENANIDIESFKSIDSELTVDYLKSIHAKYCDSIDQILTMLSSPLMLMTYTMSKVKETHLSIQSAVKLGFFIQSPPKDPKDTAKYLVDFFQEELRKANDNIVEDAYNESRLLYDKSEEIRNCFYNIGFNALVNSWTIFEAYTKDIWIKILNNNPQLLNQKIVHFSIDKDNGSNSKTIPLNLLSKYDFNIYNHLGDILSTKYDFTGVLGIKKAYNDLFRFKGNELIYLDGDKLNQLEACRHIIVHNAGIIDSRYLARSMRKNELLNQKLQIDMIEINEMINYSISCLKQTLLLVNKKITTTDKP